MSCNYQKYSETVRASDDLSVSFHDMQLAEPVYCRIAGCGGSIMDDGVAIATPIRNVTELVSEERCLRLAELIIGKLSSPDQVYLSTVPLDYYDKHILDRLGENAIIFTHSYTPNPENVTNLPIYPLRNELTGTDAGLLLYELKIANSLKALNPKAIVDAAREYSLTQSDAAISIKIGGTLDVAEKEQLWRLFHKRFDDISGNMPYLIEETRSATMSLLDDHRNVFVFVRDVNNDIVACIFVTDSKEAYPWINKDYLEARNMDQDEPCSEMFIPGIAAYRDNRGNKPSYQMIQTLAEIVAMTGYHEIRVRFECTDVSALYVPRIVQEALSERSPFDSVQLANLGKMSIVALRS